MAKATIKKSKKKKPEPVILPPLPTYPPTVFSGSCKCGPDTTTLIGIRIPYHPAVKHQMITSVCTTCGKTFYLTEDGGL